VLNMYGFIVGFHIGFDLHHLGVVRI